MKVFYDLDNLETMLTAMGEYLAENKGEGYESDFGNGLFESLTKTALFHDACGKIIDSNENEVVVTTDY